MDSGATDSFINREFMFSNHMKSEPGLQNIVMATKSLSAEILGVVKSNMTYGGQSYSVKLKVLNNLCEDLILGHDFIKQHKKIVFNLGTHVIR